LLEVEQRFNLIVLKECVMRIIVCFSRAVMLASIFHASTAMAQSRESDKDAAPPASKQPVDSDVLAGPSVEDEADEGNDNMMGPGGQRRRVESLPLRQWMQQVRGLDLTAPQQQDIAAIMRELEQAQQAFRAEHGEQMRQIQEQIQQMRRGGREPDPALREQLQKLEGDMPKPLDYQRRVWDVLTGEQQETLRERIAELEQRMQQQRRRNGARGADSRSPPSGDQMTSEAPMRGDAAPPMTPDNGDVRVPAGSQREEGRRRRRAAAGDGLDDMARTRVEFLRTFVSASSPTRMRAGEGPTSDQRTFRFEEDQ
jgi:hypothetical protein